MSEVTLYSRFTPVGPYCMPVPISIGPPGSSVSSNPCTGMSRLSNTHTDFSTSARQIVDSQSATPHLVAGLGCRAWGFGCGVSGV